MHPKKREAILKSLENGCSKAAACAAARVGRSSFYAEVSKNPEFAEEVEIAIGLSVAPVECALRKQVMQPNCPAALKMFYLMNRAPQDWQDRRGVLAPDEVGRYSDEAAERRALAMLEDEARRAIEERDRAALAAEYPGLVRAARESGRLAPGRAPTEN